MELLGLIPTAVCVPNLSEMSLGNSRVGGCQKWASSPHEMNQVRDMDGASSSLKHISAYKLSDCSKDNKNEKRR